MSQISTHILDGALGCPAADVLVALQSDAGVEIASGTTDADGRVADLGPEHLEAGTYRLSFATGEYFGRTRRQTFYPVVSIAFSVADAEQHYHVPLLISPFAYSTYKGS
ncbi:hydroxyisourate hydrolase [Cryobacterium sp. Y11]|jgi:5-hydroxyisourate hydrolase|uniref:hydroxyisourate hydrolase n=1 Tax=Cryobacterium sp. Y11 TaxID=2045016 RepID=UPI000CE3C065|nr:hydroxyisourate hydrolase [Cryobacterium sp. Y11]